MDILRINAIDTHPIRQQMLRQGKERQTCLFEGDEADQTFHLGGFVEGHLVSITSFYFEKHPRFEDPYQYRLRGMATLPEYQGQGFSSALLKMAFPIIKQNLCTLLWCNARTTAQGYYQKVGFEKVGDEFATDEGPHILMFKKII